MWFNKALISTVFMPSLLWSTAVFSQTDNSVRDEGIQLKKRPFIVYPNGAYYALELPDTISTREIDFYGRLLQLSDEQKVVASNSYERYLDAEANLRATEVSQLYRLSSDVWAMEPYQNQIGAEKYATLKNHVQEFVDDVEGRENEFFDSWIPWLSGTQLEALAAVKASCIRSRNVLEIRVYPGSNIDLLSLLDTLCSENEVDISQLITRKSEFRVFFEQYDSIITPLFEELTREKRRAGVHNVRFSAQYHVNETNRSSQTADPDPTGQKYLNAQTDIMKEQVRLAKRILKSNVIFVELFADALPGTLGIELKNRFNASAYTKQIYPDHCDLESLFQSLSQRADISEKHSEEIQDIHQTFRHEHDGLNKKLVERYLNWKEGYALTHSSNNDRLREYRDEMNRLLNKRRKNSRIYFEQFKLTLGDDLDAEWSQYFADWESLLSQPITPFRTGFPNIDRELQP